MGPITPPTAAQAGAADATKASLKPR